jgi:Domain of unknown function (DUF4194)
MLRELEKIIDEADTAGGNGETLERELRAAAQLLWRSQFLYESDWGAKTAYDLIRRHAPYFEHLFDALGYRIVGRPADRFLGLLAIELPPRQSMKLDESLLLLVMRLYYEEALKRFEVNEAGEVEVESEALLEVYEDRTHRLRPLIGRVREILIAFRQRGLVRFEEHEDRRSFTLFLRPALPIVLAEDALSSLENFVAEKNHHSGTADEITPAPGDAT